MKATLIALGVALTFALLPATGRSQNLAPIYAGPTPDPAATACPGETMDGRSTAFEPHITITPASMANFRAHNSNDYGSFLVALRYDGRAAALISPGPQFDRALRQAISDFTTHVTLKPPLADCARMAQLLAVRFNIADGTAGFQALPQAPKALPSGVPLSSVNAPIVMYGPTPDPAGSTCPGETDGGRGVTGPRTVVIPPDSVAYVREHDHRDFVLAILVLRLDGEASITFPTAQDVDAPLRDTLVAYARNVHLQPAIAGCAHQAAIMTARVSLTDGSVTITQVTGKH